jgi:hypothetical protein
MNAPRPLLGAAAASLALLAGCAHPPKPYDYTAFQKSRPATLLVLPPVNESPDVKATPGVWANATLPLAEAGYYVLPVTLVDATFKQNGVTDPHDAQALPWQKLHDVFGADAAVYIKVTRYGTSYQVIASDTRVEVAARLVDLRDGALLWEGNAVASSTENQSGQGGLAALLVRAIVQQVIGSATDASFNFAAIADTRMLGAPRVNGLLPGPRSPAHGQVPTAP